MIFIAIKKVKNPSTVCTMYPARSAAGMRAAAWATSIAAACPNDAGSATAAAATGADAYSRCGARRGGAARSLVASVTSTTAASAVGAWAMVGEQDCAFARFGGSEGACAMAGARERRVRP